jgi:hypothetical protein
VELARHNVLHHITEHFTRDFFLSLPNTFTREISTGSDE